MEPPNKAVGQSVFHGSQDAGLEFGESGDAPYMALLPILAMGPRKTANIEAGGSRISRREFAQSKVFAARAHAD